MKFGTALLAITATIVVTAGLAIAAGVRLNVTASMPVGLYQQTAVSLQRGALVVACLDTSNQAVAVAIKRGYLPVGNCPGDLAPVMKRIAAVGGDRIELGANGLAVNGKLIPLTRPLPFDPRGLHLPTTYPRSYTLGYGHALLLAPGAGSFDGRYFGPTPISSIRAGARPLLVATNR